MSSRSRYRFGGFPEGKVGLVTLPESVFSELIPHIDDLDELKVTLLVLWRLAQIHTTTAPWVTLSELCADPVLRRCFERTPSETHVEALLDRAVERGVLLRHDWMQADGTLEVRYFANSPRGRAVIAAMQRGHAPDRWVRTSTPNIYALYEENIGPLTAMLSEELMEAERTYPAAWIEEAFREAVHLNRRNWRYIRAILERWRTEGKDEIDRRDRETDSRRYIEGEYGDLIKH